MVAIISEVKGLVKNDFNKEKKKPQDTILWLSKHCLFIYKLSYNNLAFKNSAWKRVLRFFATFEEDKKMIKLIILVVVLLLVSHPAY